MLILEQKFVAEVLFLPLFFLLNKLHTSFVKHLVMFFSPCQEYSSIKIKKCDRHRYKKPFICIFWRDKVGEGDSLGVKQAEHFCKKHRKKNEVDLTHHNVTETRYNL